MSPPRKALAGPEDATRLSHGEKKAERRRIKELERRLRRKDETLTEIAARLTLTKKSPGHLGHERGTALSCP